jgi:hypothetical protein
VTGLPRAFVALYLQCRGRGRWGVRRDPDEDKTADSRKLLTMTMFSVIVLQPLELQIPVFLIVLAIETNFVKHPFSFRIHTTILEVKTLVFDPTA